MGMRGNRFYYNHKTGVAIAPQTVTNAAAATGLAINEPWRLGRQLTFILLCGAIAAGHTGITCVVQGKTRAAGSWVTLKAYDGITDLGFTASKINDAGELETAGTLAGTVDFETVDGTVYSDIRLLWTFAGTGACLVAASYVISDTHQMLTTNTDDLYSKTRRA